MARELIDTHQHLWVMSERAYSWIEPAYGPLYDDFTPERLAPEIPASGVTGSVLVQAADTYDDTFYMLDIAAHSDFVRGVVGWVPLCDGSVEGYLDKYASHEKIVGFRHVLHDEPDDNFMLRQDFNAGIRALGRYPLCYDLLIFEKHLPQTIQFADMHPGLSMVVDHIAKPVIRRNQFDHAWAANIRQLAKREHVCCKLSGMVTEVRDGAWDEQLLKPYFDVVLEAFGPYRLMFGSDWPVANLGGTYLQIVELAEALTSGLSPSETEFFWHKSAAAAYRLA